MSKIKRQIIETLPLAEGEEASFINTGSSDGWTSFWKNLFIGKPFPSREERLEFVKNKTEFTPREIDLILLDPRQMVITEIMEKCNSGCIMLKKRHIEKLLESPAEAIKYRVLDMNIEIDERMILKILKGDNGKLINKIIEDRCDKLTETQVSAIFKNKKTKNASYLKCKVIDKCKLSEVNQTYLFSLVDSSTSHLIAKKDFMPSERQWEIMQKLQGGAQMQVEKRRSEFEANFLKGLFVEPSNAAKQKSGVAL